MPVTTLQAPHSPSGATPSPNPQAHGIISQNICLQIPLLSQPSSKPIIAIQATPNNCSPLQDPPTFSSQFSNHFRGHHFFTLPILFDLICNEREISL
jgi:hypothetical protein